MRKLFPKALRAVAPTLLILLTVVSLDAPVKVSVAKLPEPLRTWTVTASWYGPGFHGRPTASGQPFDMYAATAAHRWLPLGSVVRVVNESTGESQIARINDRGPYFDGRELDVSYMLASRLGILEPGTASVRIELLEQPRRRPQTP